jgi:NAD-dependent dihydropyrimidine dehydrogenase PreA subunit
MEVSLPFRCLAPRIGAPRLTYVIYDPCIATKDNSCVEVCPVDCIHPTVDEPGYAEAEQLYIDPSECIDCDACVDACPVQAILSADDLPANLASFIDKNAEYYRLRVIASDGS